MPFGMHAFICQVLAHVRLTPCESQPEVRKPSTLRTQKGPAPGANFCHAQTTPSVPPFAAKGTGDVRRSQQGSAAAWHTAVAVRVPPAPPPPPRSTRPGTSCAWRTPPWSWSTEAHPLTQAGPTAEGLVQRGSPALPAASPPPRHGQVLAYGGGTVRLLVTWLSGTAEWKSDRRGTRLEWHSFSPKASGRWCI